MDEEALGTFFRGMFSSAFDDYVFGTGYVLHNHKKRNKKRKKLERAVVYREMKCGTTYGE